MVPLGLFCILILGIAAPSYACNNNDLESLMLLSLKASPPLNWSASTDCCFWEGISCDQSGRVDHLELPFRGLKGKITRFLGNLTHLSHLNLSHNFLYGSLSDSLFSSLIRLDTIDLSFNSLSGELASLLTLPSSIRAVEFSSNHFNGTIVSPMFHNASNLVSFNVSNNSFIGLIPSHICSEANLIKFLDFSHNEFSGQIPHGLEICYELEVFRAGFNRIKGLLPYDIYNVPTLKELSLPVNHLYGSIGDEIVQCSNLIVLDLYVNELTGKIPTNIGELSKLQQLRIHENKLSGPLPESLMNCSDIITLSLRVNFLEGEITAFNFSKLKSLRIFDLGINYLTGKLPESLFMCKSLVAVRLSSNKLVGEIPAGVSRLQSLSFISLSNNSLINVTGAIKNLMSCKRLTVVILSMNFFHETLPDSPSIPNINGFKNLTVLALGGCQLFGRFPTWIEKLKELQVVDLSLNELTGVIPGWLGTLPNIFYLDLSGNRFSGEFPRELCTLQALTLQQTSTEVKQFPLELPVIVNSRLEYTSFSFLPPTINLKNNSLSGNIPTEIGQLKLLHVIELSMNNFIGRIPGQISELINLERLDLSDNQLSGEIPPSLKSLSFLSLFSVANNKLTGIIPSGTQLQNFPASSYTGNPSLCGFPLSDKCHSGSAQSVNDYMEDDEEPETETKWSYVIAGLGYLTGLLIVCFTLLCHTSWSNAYFNFVTNLIGKYMP